MGCDSCFRQEQMRSREELQALQQELAREKVR